MAVSYTHLAAAQEMERLAKGTQSERQLLEQVEHIRAVWGDS